MRKEREAFLSKYDDLKAPHTEKIDKLEAEKNELTGSNSAKIAERDKAKKACSWTLFLIIAGVLAAIGIYSRSLVSIVFFVAAVALVVVKFLIYKKNKPIYEKLKLELADYDNKCAELSTLIGEEEAAIAKINEDASEYVKLHGRIERDVMNELSDIAYRERYHNTLAVYIGSKYAESETPVEMQSLRLSAAVAFMAEDEMSLPTRRL